MALSEKKVNTAAIGRLSEQSIWIVRYLKIFFDVMFTFENDEKNEKITNVKCLGCGLINRNVEIK